MLDIPRLERIRIQKWPWFQDVMAWSLEPNIRLLPGVEVEFEHWERVPDAPVIFAMNHTDRFNYLPFQMRLRSEMGRYTATWVKGKYYENFWVGKVLELANQLPTVSRGYLITRDFLSAVGRTPRDEEYRSLRHWVDAVAVAEVGAGDPFADGRGDLAGEIEKLPPVLLSQSRNVLGYAFDPGREDYAGYINSLFGLMMNRFVELNRKVFEIGLDMLIFPQGTRSVRLSPGHIGLGEAVLAFEQTVVPVGCNGSDLLYPGSLPFARAGRVVYRFGEPLPYEAFSRFHIQEPFEPFSPRAEHVHRDAFQGVVDEVMERINDLLDEPYRFGDEPGGGVRGSDRFV
jgi:1-acyl-sn-glycerol-3-phosphate acyltransferase